MALKLIVLGSGGSMPTKERSLSSLVVRREGEVLMFDCGEGTQRQFMLAKIGFNKPMRIFITHMHGDHVLGLPGLLMTMSLQGRTKEMGVYGPTGVKEFLDSVTRIIRPRIEFHVSVEEIVEGQVYRTSGYHVQATFVDHTIPCFAYALVEDQRPGKFRPDVARSLGVKEGPLWKKLQQGEAVEVAGRVVRPQDVMSAPRAGWKIVYSIDTRPCDAVVRLADGADLLIHDSTFDDSMEDRAGAYGHSTARQAAEVASRAGARRLLLTHISAMYKDARPLLDQARMVFGEVTLAEDLMTLELKGK